MGYGFEILNMVLACLFVTLLVEQRRVAFLLFFTYYGLLKFAVHDLGSLSTISIHYELFAVLIYIAIIYLSRKVCLRLQLAGSLKVFGLLWDDNRVVLISKLWASTVVATSTMGLLRYHGSYLPSENFYVSWSVNVIFFSVIGLVAALVSLRLPHNEEFLSRLGILFTGTENINNEFRQSALLHISDEVKRLGLALSSIERVITIETFDADFDAYRANVKISTSMVSLFGDVDAQDDVQFTVTPDGFTHSKKKPDPAGQIISLFVNGEEKIRGNPLPILIGRSSGFPEKFSVGRDGQSFTFEYWCWFETEQAFTYQTKRFCREFSVKIINRILDGAVTNVVVKRPKAPNGSQVDIKNLSYGDEWDVNVIRDMEPKTVTELFTLQRPAAAGSGSYPTKSDDEMEAPEKT